MKNTAGSRGWAVWFTGLPGSGKSTLARAVGGSLEERGVPTIHLEMDARRKVYFPKPTYTPEERAQAYDRFIQEAAGLVAQGRGVLMDGTAHRLAVRAAARKQIQRFAEVFIRCPLDLAMAREQERPEGLVMAGLYAKALDRRRTGREHLGLGQVIGVDVPFEEDAHAECVVDVAVLTLDQARDQVLQFLESWLK
ncbi:adenylyl-sulfate kinase [Desulfonatronum thioautotrophicum]|uniref:adenylyl-sulfate kinase n=1 Tax=Desulfonatronum thioautotrophicum TaxID=617001 RepID=UPI0005EB2A4B|nr:adenylyl-sulfate kinase [Desulfonatronum thioautotrophicum]